MKEFMLGAMYWLNPNFGKKEIEEDMRKIRDNHFNVIRSFIWWEKVEARKGVWDFRQHDILLEAADKFGLKIMQTFGLYLPLWLQKELLLKGIDDRERRYPCFDRPEVATPMEVFVRKAVERYKNAPAMYLWNLWNEPTQPPCRCPSTLARFCAWLKRKYPTIEALKNAWLGEFQVFTTACPDSMEELTPEWLDDAFEFGSRGRIAPMESDWLAFSFDNSCTNIAWLRDIVRSIDPVHETHANPSTPIENSLLCGLDEWKLAKELDTISISVHPSHHFSCEKPEHYPEMFLYCIDEVRSWGKTKDAWIGELQAGTTLYHPSKYTPYPEDISHTLYHALGRGLRGVLFWEWQAWRSSMMEVGEFSLRRAQDGAPTERSEAAKAFGADIIANKKFIDQANRPKAEVAIFSSMTARSLKFQQYRNKSFIPGVGDEHNHAVLGCYKALNRAHIAVDFVSEAELQEGILQQYKVLYVPQVEMMTEATAEALKTFVRNGGAIWADGRCGWLDDHVYLRSVVPGHGLDKMFGCEEGDFIAIRDEKRTGKLQNYRHSQFLQPTTGTVLAFAKNHPAAVRNVYGKGTAELWGGYFTLGLVRQEEDPATMDAIAEFAFAHGAAPVLPELPLEIECSCLTGAQANLYILGNRTAADFRHTLHFSERFSAFQLAEAKFPGGSDFNLNLAPHETIMLIAIH